MPLPASALRLLQSAASFTASAPCREITSWWVAEGAVRTAEPTVPAAAVQTPGTVAGKEKGLFNREENSVTFLIYRTDTTGQRPVLEYRPPDSAVFYTSEHDTGDVPSECPVGASGWIVTEVKEHPAQPWWTVTARQGTSKK